MKNETIPNQSEASLKNGTWLIHDDGIHTLQIWGSNTNGKEAVYLDGTLVSEFRSVKRTSEHHFSDESGNNYVVKSAMTSLFKGVRVCFIIRNGKVVKTFTIKYQRDNIAYLKRLFILMLFAAILGLMSVVFELPRELMYVILAFIVIFSFIKSKHGRLIIEE